MGKKTYLAILSLAVVLSAVASIQKADFYNGIPLQAKKNISFQVAGIVGIHPG